MTSPSQDNAVCAMPRRGTWYDMDKIKPVVLTEKLLDIICSKKEHTLAFL